MVTQYHLLLGNAPKSALLSIPPGLPLPEQETTPWTPPLTVLAVTGPSPQSKQQHHLPDWMGPPSPPEATSKATPKEPHHSKAEGENAPPQGPVKESPGILQPGLQTSAEG